MEISKFANVKQKEYSIYNNYRKIGSYIDGLKPSGRKLLWGTQSFKSFLKVDMIANSVAGSSQYLHGASNLEGVLKGLCNDYAGTNNVPLFKKDGFFGTRTEMTPGASRYVKSKLSDVSGKIYRKEDYELLTAQEFEGFSIEPKHYVPIIPMILINGSEGMGNGFSHNVTTRHPREVANWIFEHLGDRQPSSLLPHYEGFKGTVEEDPKQPLRFFITGCMKVVNTTTIIIDELPVGYSLSKYKTLLEELEENKIIRSYKDKSNKNSFLFELKVPRSTTSLDENKLLSVLKLRTSIMENLTLVGEKNQIIEFESSNEIMENFCEIRLEYYHKRKSHTIDKMMYEIEILKNKISFITDINSDTIIFKGNNKKSIEKQLITLEYMKVEKSFNYLLNMSIHNLTLEKIDQLDKELKQLKIELDKYRITTVDSIWKEEINELLVAIGEKKIRITKTADKTPIVKQEESSDIDSDDLF